VGDGIKKKGTKKEFCRDSPKRHSSSSSHVHSRWEIPRMCALSVLPALLLFNFFSLKLVDEPRAFLFITFFLSDGVELATHQETSPTRTCHCVALVIGCGRSCHTICQPAGVPVLQGHTPVKSKSHTTTTTIGRLSPGSRVHLHTWDGHTNDEL
jgi:hypothetical protein